MSCTALQANNWSLEDLELHIDIGATDIQGANDTIVERLILEGAVYSSGSSRANTSGGSGSVELSEELRHPLPPSRLSWRPKLHSHSSGGSDGKSGSDSSSSRLELPLYHDQTRQSLVGEIYVQAPVSTTGSGSGSAADSSLTAGVWAQRGVAFVMRSYAM